MNAFDSNVNRATSLKNKINQAFQAVIDESDRKQEKDLIESQESGAFVPSYSNTMKTKKFDTPIVKGFIPSRKPGPIGVFEISDKKNFPKRTKKTPWMVGLRNYGDDYVKKERYVEPEKVEVPIDNSHDDDSLKEIKRKDRVPEKLDSLSYASVNSSCSLLSVTSEMSPEKEANYFNFSSKMSLNVAYRQISHHGNHFIGGFNELHDIIQDEKKKNSLDYLTNDIFSKNGINHFDDEGNELDTNSFLSNLENNKISTPSVDGNTFLIESQNELANSVDENLLPGEKHFDLQDGSIVSYNYDDLTTIAKPNKNQIALEHIETVELPEDPLYNHNSPRAIFLTGCLKNSLAPRSSLILRKNFSPELNLGHLGIGEKLSVILSEALPTLPFLKVLDICDNNLNDKGLSEIIKNLVHHPTIEILNISQNKFGPLTSKHLGSFLLLKNNKLKCLKLNNNQINDIECNNFIKFLKNNKVLHELDLSHNIIGVDENLSSFRADVMTGPESIANLLKNNFCRIESLDLHWNMIRMKGAEILCESLYHNRYLLSLDLSYNSIGSTAASILGSALMKNNCLKYLNLGNNNIDVFGCFTIFVGMRENKSLRQIIMDGNPIGDQGARMLMRLAASEGHRLVISTLNCDFSISNKKFKLKLEAPCAEYSLNLAIPSERSILMELLDLSANDTNIAIGKFEYIEGSKKSIMKIEKFELQKEEFSESEIDEIKDLETLQKLSKLHVNKLREIVQKYEKGTSGIIYSTNVIDILNDFELKPIQILANNIVFTLDPNASGKIAINEFIEYLVSLIQNSQFRIHLLKNTPSCAVYSEVRELKRYIPPNTGIVNIKIVESYRFSDSSLARSYPLTYSKCNEIIKVAEKSSNPLQLLLYAIDVFCFLLEEGQIIFKYISSRSDDKKTAALSKILLHMDRSTDAMRMVKCFAFGDIMKIRRLKQILGHCYYPVVGIYNGFYSLDLSVELDRICLRKLIEVSVRNVSERKAKGKWDTSQLGHWSCFRNEVHYDEISITNTSSNSNGQPLTQIDLNSIPDMEPDDIKDISSGVKLALAINPDRYICPKYFMPMPKKGKLEFDFINIARPNMELSMPVPDEYIIDLLLISRLIDVQDIPNCKLFLLNLIKSLSKLLISDGRPYWKPDFSRGLAIAELLHKQYSNLQYRSYFLKVAKKRELTKGSNQAQKKGESKQSNRSGGNIKKSVVTTNQENNNASNLQINFLCFDERGKTESIVGMWDKRMSESMDPNGSDEYKSAALLEFFETELSSVWLLCRQVSLIIQTFSFGNIPRSNVGSYRVEFLVNIFDKIIDLHNFEVITMQLNAEEHSALLARIGILNIFNPCKPEGGYSFDLLRWEDRQAAKMMIHFNMVEPGENWNNKRFIFDHGFIPNPGWDLNVTWLTEEGLPKKGVLTIDLYSGDGLQQKNTTPDPYLRHVLTSLVLVDIRDYFNDLSSQSLLKWNPFIESCERAQVDYKESIKEQESIFNSLIPPTTQVSPNSNYVLFNFELSNKHLVDETDISWNYTSSNLKFETWNV